MKYKYRSTLFLVCVVALLSVRFSQSPQSGCNAPAQCPTSPMLPTPSTDVTVIDPLFTTPDWPFWRQVVHIKRNHWTGPAWYSIRNATAFSQYGILFSSTESVMNSDFDYGNFIRQLSSNPTLGTYPVTVDVRNQDKSILGSKTFTFAIVPDEGIYILRTPISMRQGSSDTTVIYLFQYQLKGAPIWPSPQFTSPVQLQALDEPGNVSFSPFSYIGDNFGAPISASTMRITMPANATPGRHLLRVRGTSQQNGEQRDAIMEVDVLGPTPPLSISPDYAVSTLNSPATATVRLDRTSCTDPVMLYSQNTGGGTAVFSPNPIPGNSTTSVLSVPSLAPSTYRQIVYRIYGNPCNLFNSHTYFTVMDLPAESRGHLLLVPTQPQLIMNQGQTASFDIALLRFGGFSQSVTFTAQNSIPGVVVTISPTSTTASVTTLTYTAASPNAIQGNIEVIGTAVSGDTSRFTAAVRGGGGFNPSFNIVPETYTQVSRGGSSRNILNIQRKDLTGPIDLVVFGVPVVGITTSFSDPSPTGNQSDLTISVAQSLPPGKYVMTVQGNYSGGYILNYANFILVVL
jgi:hypothetical protein